MLNNFYSNIAYSTLLLILCNTLTFSTIDTVDISDEEYINPRSGIPFMKVKEKGDGYPYATRTFPHSEYLYTVTLFYTFCSFIEDRFEFSNMTNEEAEKIHALLDEFEYLEGQWGMPSPDYKRRKFNVRKRIMLKKISNSAYEIFYHLTGCGATIYYSRITIINGKIHEKEPIEKWRLNSPC